MTPREAFRYGFLLRCAEENLSPEQVEDRVKQANLMQLLGGAMIAPPLVGGALGMAGGYAAAQATEPVHDVEEIKKQEIAQAHRLLTAQLQQRQKMRELTAMPRRRSLSHI